MKKIVFAFKVFGLLAMFPIVVILEMNHVTGGTIENNTPSEIIKNTEVTNSVLPEKVYTITVEILL